MGWDRIRVAAACGWASAPRCSIGSLRASSARTSRAPDLLAREGAEIRRFHAFLPTIGVAENDFRDLWAVGGNIFSFDLARRLAFDAFDIVHTHALNRIGGIAHRMARLRRVPCVASIHGGYLDIPDATRNATASKASRGFDWGKPLGALVGSRRVVHDVDAVITCNAREAELIRENAHNQNAMHVPHGVPFDKYAKRKQEISLRRFVELADRDVLLCVGRIDPLKTSASSSSSCLRSDGTFRKPLWFWSARRLRLATIGGYAEFVAEHDLENHVFFLGGLTSGSDELIGLFQAAKAVLLPSKSETFGIVQIEAWAAGTPVICSRTTGASMLVDEGRTGYLYDIDDAGAFLDAARRVLSDEDGAQKLGESGRASAREKYDVAAVARQYVDLYRRLQRES